VEIIVFDAVISITLQPFLRTMLLDSQSAVLRATGEQDKREKLLHVVVEVLSKYSQLWCVMPSAAVSHGDVAFMNNLALSCVGYGASTSTSTAVSGAGAGAGGQDDGSSAASTSAAAAANSMGLRLEAFAAFFVLHLLGRVSAAASDAMHAGLPVWQWALSTACSAQLHGQPVQAISLAAVARLAWINALRPADAAPCMPYVRSILSPTSPNSCLKALITSTAQAHPRSSEDGSSSQWGHGIDQFLQVKRCMLF
jgi:hypothetical protein